MRRALILLLIPLLVSCAPQAKREVWYGISDRTVFYLTYEKRGDYLVVATMERNTLLRGIRGEGLEPFEGLQELFGEKGDHFIGGDEATWVSFTQALFEWEGLIYQGVRPEADVLLSLTLNHATTLRKSGVVATLDRLSGEKSSMERLLKRMERGFKKVRIYNLDTFLPPRTEWSQLTRWVEQWLESVLIEARSKE